MTTFYRAEVIGSLLRPTYLKDARKAWEDGQLATSAFKRIEDRAVNEAIALQERAGVDIVTLEYDDWRSGPFAPLADLPQDKQVVLGVISTKKNALEPADGIIARIEEASRYFPRKQLALSTQCGFASVMQGNPIDEAAREAKLRLVADVAHRVW